MGDWGLMGVDWEQRIDYDRLRKERLQKAKDALASSEADVLFVFRTEDCRYLIVLNGINRFKILEEIDSSKLYRQYKVSFEQFSKD